MRARQPDSSDEQEPEAQCGPRPEYASELILSKSGADPVVKDEDHQDADDEPRMAQ